LGWVLAYLDDVASDMSVFHRVDDITALSGRTLFRLATRLPAYEGAMRVRAQEAKDSDPGLASPGPRGDADGAEWNPGTRATLMADPALKGLFSFG
jgi:hypothetical protein